MMKEYNHENKVIFIIDEDGDSFEVYQKSVNYEKLSNQVNTILKMDIGMNQVVISLKIQ
jgi:uncharacterized protein YrzB (UPF0473 family)